MMQWKISNTIIKTMINKQLFTFIVVLLLSVIKVNAQIVSLDERTTKDPKKGLQGDVQFHLNYTDNNTEVLQSGTKLNLQLNDSLNTYVFYTNLNLSRTDGANDLNSGNFGTIYNYKADDRVISAEAIMQYQYDGAKTLKHRFILGGGPRWKMIDKKDLKLSIVAYTIYLNELYEGDDYRNQQSVAKFSAMLSFFTNISPTMSIKHNTYYEPNYSNPSDYRIENQTTFKAKFNKRFSYQMHFIINYNSTLPDGVENLDYAIQNSLSFSF